MATTTNFGWETPDDTDYVKDGAAAMRTLGNSIDSSMADLKGGTTGQVLSKATNTDMDFVWTNGGDITEVTAGTGISGGGTSGAVTITNSMATAIDAKGDLVAGTGADTFARLAVGSNNQVLTADSTTATGLKWATPASGQNFTLLSSTALSSGTAVTISGISNANAIWVRVQNASTSSASSDMYLTFNSDNGTNYLRSGTTVTTQASYNKQAFTGDDGTYTNFRIGRMNTDATDQVKGSLLLWGCNSSGIKIGTVMGGANNAVGDNSIMPVMHVAYLGTGTISSVTLTCNAGTFDNGTLYVYTSA